MNVICEGGAEFESTINRITAVDFRPFSPPPPSPSPPPFIPNLTKPPGHEPLPSIEGCGLNHRQPSATCEDAAGAAPPLCQGMWAAYRRSTEERGTEKHEGGPSKWEARVVRHENGPRHLSWPVFSHLSFDPTNELKRTPRMMTTGIPATATRTSGRTTTRMPATTTT